MHAATTLRAFHGAGGTEKLLSFIQRNPELPDDDLKLTALSLIKFTTAPVHVDSMSHPELGIMRSRLRRMTHLAAAQGPLTSPWPPNLLHTKDPGTETHGTQFHSQGGEVDHLAIFDKLMQHIPYFGEFEMEGLNQDHG